jgi:hypothetical protein
MGAKPKPFSISFLEVMRAFATGAFPPNETLKQFRRNSFWGFGRVKRRNIYFHHNSTLKMRWSTGHTVQNARRKESCKRWYPEIVVAYGLKLLSFGAAQTRNVTR